MTAILASSHATRHSPYSARISEDSQARVLILNVRPPTVKAKGLAECVSSGRLARRGEGILPARAGTSLSVSIGSFSKKLVRAPRARGRGAARRDRGVTPALQTVRERYG